LKLTKDGGHLVQLRDIHGTVETGVVIDASLLEIVESIFDNLESIEAVGYWKMGQVWSCPVRKRNNKSWKGEIVISPVGKKGVLYPGR
jgi:hypothetical protein